MKTSNKFSCLALDMGASNIRITLGTISQEGIQYREIYRFANHIIEKDGHERWDIEHILGELISGLKQAVTVAGESISSIGVDAWGVDFALLDAGGKLVEMPVAYRDKRTEGMEKKWLEVMSRKETFERSGINFYIFNTLFQVLSLKGSPQLTAASKILFLPSFVLHALGGKPVNELTISSTSQMLNASTGNWDPVILGHLDLAPDKLGEVCAPGTITGVVDHPELKMPGTSTVAVCAHDTASAVVSVPFSGKNSVFISTGTWCLLGIESDRPILSSVALEEGFTNERGYGGTYRCLKNIVGLWLVQGLMKSLPVEEDYDLIESLAWQYDQPTHVINPDDPQFYNPDDMKQAFDEYFLKTGQDLPAGPGGYFRCAYDSLIYSFLYHIEKIEEMTGKTMDTIHLIGGGCQSDYLTRQTAAICRRKVISGPVEAATIGNILVQAMALGVIEDVNQAREWVKGSQSILTFEPVTSASPAPADYRKFHELKVQ